MGYIDELKAERAARRLQGPNIEALKPATKTVEQMAAIGFGVPMVGSVAVRTEVSITAFWRAEPTPLEDVPLLVVTYNLTGHPSLENGWSYGVVALDELARASDPNEVILDAAHNIHTPAGSSRRLEDVVPALKEMVGIRN